MYKNNEFFIKEDKIIKQNKVLTPFEFISYIVYNKNNRSWFYTPLNSLIPLVLSGLVLASLLVLISLFYRAGNMFMLYVNILALALAISLWFSMFWIEKKTGKHINIIRYNILRGFQLFVFTEGLCFLAMFWTFLHSTLAASIHTGIFNPGEGIVNFYISEAIMINRNRDLLGYHTFGNPCFYAVSSSYSSTSLELYRYPSVKVHINLFDSGCLINAWGLPLINTLILLCSAATLNASHCYILLSKKLKAIIFLILTLFLGIFFVVMQYREYKSCALNYNDGIYASCFFGITGLHGIHVILGIIALSICLFNIILNNYSVRFHQSFYFSIFYWHFVDIIWIAVWLVIYLWPSSYFFQDYYLSSCDYNFFVYNISTGYFKKLIFYNAWQHYFDTENLLYREEDFCKNKKFDMFDVLVYSKDFLLNYDFNSKKFMHNVDMERNYNFIFLNFKFFNFNLIKKDTELFCWAINEMHEDICSKVYNPMYDDINTKYFRFIFFKFADKFLNRYVLSALYKTFFSYWYLNEGKYKW